MSAGLKGKVREIVMALADIRKNKHRDVSLSAYLAANFTGNDGKALTIDEFYAELGVKPEQQTVQLLQSLDGDEKWLVPEVILDALKKGFRRSPFYAGLVARSLPIDGPVAVQPYINRNANASPAESGEGATPRTTVVTFEHKNVNLTKKDRAIMISDEVVRYCSLAVLAVHMEQLGSEWGVTQDNDLVGVLINGDQADSSNASGSIGVEDTDDGVTWKDLVRAAVRGARLGRQYRSLICNEDELLHLLALDEFKLRTAGTALLQARVFGIKLPDSWDFYCSGAAGDHKHVILDPDSAVVELVSSPMEVESERIVMRGLNGTVARITNGFSVLQRDGRMVLDDSGTFANNPWPSWMAPID